MREEVDSATEFIVKILSTHGIRLNWDIERLESFRKVLQICMLDHYRNHWFPDKPFKGSGYRCLRIVNQKMDPLIAKAGAEIGLTVDQLMQFLPSEFTMWVDPCEVSYRIGEEGSIGVLFEVNEQNNSLDNGNSSSSQEIAQSCKDQMMSSNYSTTGAPSHDSTSLNWERLASTFVAS